MSQKAAPAESSPAARARYTATATTLSAKIWNAFTQVTMPPSTKWRLGRLPPAFATAAQNTASMSTIKSIARRAVIESPGRGQDLPIIGQSANGIKDDQLRIKNRYPIPQRTTLVLHFSFFIPHSE